MSIGRTVYNALFRRTSTFAVTIVIGAFAFERVFDEGMDNLWERMNRGVSCNCFQYCTVPYCPDTLRYLDYLAEFGYAKSRL